MDRDRPAEAARKAAEDLKTGFVVLDLETTSTRTDPNVRIVEVGILSHADEVLMDERVDPERDISEVAEGIHGIEDGEVAGAATFPEIYSRLIGHLQDRRVATYNTEADREVLDKVCEHYGRPPVDAREWIDVMDLYALYRELDRSPKLVEACRAEGIDVEDAHSAIGDCRLALRLMQKMAEAANELRR